MRCARTATLSVLGHTQDTLSGVSPHPEASRPCASRTVTRTRRQMTFVTVSGPNLSGTRIVTGRKNVSAAMIWMSVGLERLMRRA